MGKYSFSREDVLSVPEVQGMIDHAGPEYRALIAFLYLWGARIGEALDMTTEDFTKSDTEIKARILTEKLRSKGPIREQHRTVPIALSSPFTPYLLEYLSSSAGRLWPFSRVTAWRKIKRLNPNCSPHVFRHTRATKLAMETNSPYALASFFGWSDLRQAMKYIHASGSLAASLADKVK